MTLVATATGIQEASNVVWQGYTAAGQLGAAATAEMTQHEV